MVTLDFALLFVFRFPLLNLSMRDRNDARCQSFELLKRCFLFPVLGWFHVRTLSDFLNKGNYRFNRVRKSFSSYQCAVLFVLFSYVSPSKADVGGQHIQLGAFFLVQENFDSRNLSRKLVEYRCEFLRNISHFIGSFDAGFPFCSVVKKIGFAALPHHFFNMSAALSVPRDGKPMNDERSDQSRSYTEGEASQIKWHLWSVLVGAAVGGVMAYLLGYSTGRRREREYLRFLSLTSQLPLPVEDYHRPQDR
jgi:hypothetical protein